nr:hypothetical protein N8D75_15165 [Curtobacterium flaccumfaciens]
MYRFGAISIRPARDSWLRASRMGVRETPSQAMLVVVQAFAGQERAVHDRVVDLVADGVTEQLVLGRGAAGDRHAFSFGGGGVGTPGERARSASLVLASPYLI